MSLLKKIRVFMLASYILVQTSTAWGLTLGTFNMEYFDISGEKAYCQNDLKYLANIISSSNSDILALQEIEGDRTMNYFVKNFLPGWNYAGVDTDNKQDLYFLWRRSKIKIRQRPCPEFVNTKLNWQGKMVLLFPRAPLRARFEDIATGFEFTMINVHLKGWGTSGKKDKLSAITYNNIVRQAQAVELTRLARETRGPVFVIGDYNSVRLQELAIPVLQLKDGHSYDNLQCTIDHIGYDKITRDSSWIVSEIETSIPERSKPRHQHPDHDMVILSITLDKR